MKKITVAIDGYSSSGKSTMAKELAREAGYIYIDTGAMYRAVALYAIRNGWMTADAIDEEALRQHVGEAVIEFRPNADGRSETMDMSLREMLRRSSNTGFALVGAEIGADDYVKYLDLFDIGEKTGIDFPGEIEGIVTDRDDYDGSTLSTMAFGQAVSVPPIQVARAGATVANDGVATTPHFLLAKGGEQTEWKDEEKRVIDKQTAEDVADIMTDVVESGTGTDAAIEGYEISGKTGTAEIASETGGYLDDTYMTSFLGFGPTKDPKVLTYVTLYGTAGVTVSQDVFRTVESTAFQTMGVTPTA